MFDRTINEVVGSQELVIMRPDLSVAEAARLMADRHIGALIVAEDGKLQGIFTERDVVDRVVARGRDVDATKLAEVMTPDPATVAPETKMMVALRTMRERSLRHLPVVDGERITGIVSIRDLLRAVIEELSQDRDFAESLWPGFPV